MIPLWIHRARPSDPARYSWSVPCRTQHAQTQPPAVALPSCEVCRRPQTRNCSLALPSSSRRECQHGLSRARSAPSSRGEASRTPGSRSLRRPSTSSSSQGARSASRSRACRRSRPAHCVTSCASSCSTSRLYRVRRWPRSWTCRLSASRSFFANSATKHNILTILLLTSAAVLGTVRGMFGFARGWSC